MELIDKAAIVAEIKKELNTAKKYSTEYVNGRKYALNKIFSFINTLEVKEVDLEKEINKYISDNFFGSETMGFFAARTNEEPNDIDIALCAKYFFKLGMQQSKNDNNNEE